MMQDLKYALRMIVKHPVFSAVAIVTLALGIGANTAIYTVVDAVLLEPLPFEVFRFATFSFCFVGQCL